MNKSMMIVLVAVVALLVGAYAGYAYEKSKLMKMMEVQRMDMEHQLDQAKMENTKMLDAEERGDTIAPTSTMMKDKVDDKMTVTPTVDKMMDK